MRVKGHKQVGATASLQSVEARLSQVPFMRRFALKCAQFSEGSAETFLECQPNLMNESADGIDQAAIMSVMDQLGSIAIWSRYGLNHPHATVSMSVAFLEPAGADPVWFEGRILAVSRGLCHTSLLASDSRTGHVIAHGRSSFLMGAYAGGHSALTKWESVQTPLEVMSCARSFCEEIGATTADAVCRLPFLLELVGSREPDMLHGGAIAAGLIVSARSVADLPDGQVLSGLSIEFLRGGLNQETTFHSVPVQSSRRASTFSISALQNDNRQIALGLARFTDFTGI